MTGDELQALGRKTWGRGAQARIARGLAVDARTVRRWATGEIEIPEERAEAIAALAERATKAREFARGQLDRIIADAAAAGLDRAEVLAELAERVLVHSAISNIAARKPAKG